MLKKLCDLLMDFFGLFEEKPDEVICPECFGKKTVLIHRRPDRSPDPFDTIVPCPICRGTGYVQEFIKKEEEK